MILGVFTKHKYGGNPLAVFPEVENISEDLFPVIAKELNLSETVFLNTPSDDGAYPVRIFTPVKELPMAGHTGEELGFSFETIWEEKANRRYSLCYKK